MELISRQRAERFLAEHDAIESLAREAFNRYSELTGKKAHAEAASYGEFSIEDGTLRFAGKEYWSYGGEQHHDEELPACCLHDASFWQELEVAATERMKRAKAAAAKRRSAAARNAKKKEAAAEKKERAELERLKAIYEPEGAQP